MATYSFAALGFDPAVLADGRVIDEFEGEVIQIGDNWRAALDNLILGRGTDVKLAEDYEVIGESE